VKAGDVFRLVKKADNHSWVIISDPEHYPDKVLIVNMTSWDRLEDQSCLLNHGDHSTVHHRTCIAYSRAKCEMSNSDLDRLKAAKLIMSFEPVPPELLKRIRAGAMQSIRMAQDFKDMLIAQGLTP